MMCALLRFPPRFPPKTNAVVFPIKQFTAGKDCVCEQSGVCHQFNSQCFCLSDEQDEETVATGGKVTAGISC